MEYLKVGLKKPLFKKLYLFCGIAKLLESLHVGKEHQLPLNGNLMEVQDWNTDRQLTYTKRGDPRVDLFKSKLYNDTSSIDQTKFYSTQLCDIGTIETIYRYEKLPLYELK
jgi:hypothetical protein